MTKTKYEINCHLAYQVRLAELHQRLYGRLRKAISFLTLLSGSSAFAGAFGGSGITVAVSGFMITGLTLLDQVCDFGGAVGLFGNQRKRYLDLSTRMTSLTADELVVEYRKIEMDDPTQLESLRIPAFNDMLISSGHDEEITPLSWFSRVLRWLT